MRAVPHLGRGVVLGRRRPRRRHGAAGHRRWRSRCPPAATLSFVGPDNGLLVAAAEAAGEAPVAARGRAGAPRRRRPTGAPPSTGATSSPRPRPPCAPARALEAAGGADRPGVAGAPRSAAWSSRAGCTTGGAACAAEVTWVDHFGNLQLAATVADARVAGIPLTGSVELAARIESGRADLDGLPHSLVPDGVQLRCVDAFGELEQGEFGLLVDANGHLAVVAGEASAAHWLNVAAGELLVLAW